MDTSNFCCISIIIFILFVIVPITIWVKYKDYEYMTMPKHRPNHPGISIDTLYGKKDVHCPKCNSPYTMYCTERIVTPVTAKTKTKVHPINPFKPFVEEVTTISGGNVYNILGYRCKNCGHIFIAW